MSWHETLLWGVATMVGALLTPNGLIAAFGVFATLAWRDRKGG